MPILNGLEAAQRLKKIMPNIPIILFTQYADHGNGLFGAEPLVDRIVSNSNPQSANGTYPFLHPCLSLENL